MKAFKGFDKDLKCRDYQFALGETFTHKGKVSLCNSGFHVVENPLDALSYYGLAQGIRYAEVEADGVSDQTEADSKRVCSTLKIGAELSLKSLIEFGIKFIFKKAKSAPTSDEYAHSATSGNFANSATSGNSAYSATSGNYAYSATSGNSAHSATSGNSAHSATSGNYAHSATTGDYSHSATSGYSAHSATSGYSANSATSGNSAHSATTGDYAHASAMGKNSIAAAIGKSGEARAAVGNWIVLSEYDKDGNVKTVKTAKVDGKKIKADTLYVLKAGKFVKA